MMFADFHGYLIADTGDIIGKQTNSSTGERKYVIPHQNKNGYLIVKLYYNNKTYTHYVHRLVAELFLDKPDGCDVVDHKDNNPRNNCVDNLEWVTRSDNAKRALKNVIVRKDNRIVKINVSNRDITLLALRPARGSPLFA